MRKAHEVERESQLRRWVIGPVGRAFNANAWTVPKHPWRGFSSQVVMITVAGLAYFGARMVTKGADSLAFSNAQDLIAFERSLGIYVERTAQQLVLDNRAIVTFFNWVYIWFHWPVVLGSFFFLYRNAKGTFVLYRNAIFVSGAIGLIIFITYPVAPPRFLDGFTDTVAELSTSYKFWQPPSIVNKYAALPSFHVGWNLLAGVMLFHATKTRAIRVFAVMSPALMTAAVVFTANHYIIDAIVGVAIAMVGLGGAVMIRRYTSRLDLTPPPPTPDAIPVSTSA